MSAHKKSHAIKIVGTIIIFLVLTTIAAQLIFTSKVKTVLEEEIPPSINVSYEALSTNVLFGEISLNKVNAKHLVHNLDFEAESITISGLRYLPLLLNGDITIVDLTVRSPKMIYYHPSEKNSTSKPAKKAPVKTYVIKKFNIENGSFVVRNTSLDSTDTVEGIDFSISDILYGPESAKEDIPFSYGDFKLNTKKDTAVSTSWNMQPLSRCTFLQVKEGSKTLYGAPSTALPDFLKKSLRNTIITT